jgi:hypothetical protein
MSQLLVRDLPPETVARLKAQACLHGRSLQGEVKRILEEAIQYSLTEACGTAAEWRQRLAGQVSSDSTELLHEDRDR